jgi:hypothetical protein
MLLSSLAYSSILRVEAIYNAGWLTGYTAFIPQDKTLHNHRCENLKFDIYSFIFQLLVA